MTTLMSRETSVGSIELPPESAYLWARYEEVRAFTESLCSTLEPEDYVVQSMEDASPTKWHLAHTSWFFETFLLKRFLPSYSSRFPQYDFLFNSYYNSIGDRHCRAKRGVVSRPTVTETYEYREYVDDCLRAVFDNLVDSQMAEFAELLILGLNHEQQHQELLLTDIKHVFSENPLLPVFRKQKHGQSSPITPIEWMDFPGGLVEIGSTGEQLMFDNEGPRHKVWLEPFSIASRPATNKEYMEFMEDAGYKKPELWLSDGWSAVNRLGWEAPMYWEKSDGNWGSMTLSGFRPIDPSEPVTHISYYEADAFAQWQGGRLPGEEEWEVAARTVPIEGNFAESSVFHPTPAPPGQMGLVQMFGDVWEWTRSSYARYPGYVAPPGALGEYNGKFTCNQFVLRGGSCATAQSHIRAGYRNFFPPEIRWQFNGVRVARNR